MVRFKKIWFIEFAVFILMAFLLEYLIAYPVMILHISKDGGLTSELVFLFIITILSLILEFRKHLAHLLIGLVLYPLLVIVSYFVWFYFLNDEGVGFLILYIFFFQTIKIIVSKYTKGKKENGNSEILDEEIR